MMNFFVSTVVVLIAIQGAYAIRCHKCVPDNSSMGSVVSPENISALNLCSNPTGTVDCSQDPNIGNIADACYTASVGLTYNISLVNLHGEIKYYVLDCAIKSMCNQLKTLTCDTLKTTFAGMSGFGISNCDVSCCEGDLCNNPSGPPATNPPTTPPTTTSSVKSTHIPTNVAIFGILGLFTMALMSLF